MSSAAKRSIAESKVSKISIINVINSEEKSQEGYKKVRNYPGKENQQTSVQTPMLGKRLSVKIPMERLK